MVYSTVLNTLNRTENGIWTSSRADPSIITFKHIARQEKYFRGPKTAKIHRNRDRVAHRDDCTDNYRQEGNSRGWRPVTVASVTICDESEQTWTIFHQKSEHSVVVSVIQGNMWRIGRQYRDLRTPMPNTMGSMGKPRTPSQYQSSLVLSAFVFIRYVMSMSIKY